MAKKSGKKESGPGTFMILTLVFFVLSTVILGITTYMGFDGQAQLEENAKKAKEEAKTLQARVDEETARKIVLRTALGIETPEDRESLSGAARANATAILDEHQKLTATLGGNAFPTRDAFQWPLMTALAGGGAAAGGGGGAGDSLPAPAPNRTVPAITKIWARMYQDAQARYNAEVAAKRRAEANAQAAQDAADKAKEVFDTKVADLTKQVQDKVNAMQTAFTALKTEADKKGVEFKRAADEWADARAKMDDLLKVKDNDLLAKDQRIRQLLNPDPSDWEFKFRHWNVARTAERMGTVTDKSGTFVTLQFPTRMSLVPGQTFVVISPTGSLVEVLEREKALEKRHHEHSSLGPRDPFTDNEYIKGMVELTEVTGNGFSARARVTHEAAPIRNPISRSDQLFNVSLSTAGKEHVAFAGIIDLDGDGRPDNEQFVRILEKNNLVVDAYLDLKTGEIKKRGDGIDFKTKFLIVGSDAPLVGGVKAMIDQAREKGVQQIDARMFLTLIGVKPPKNPAAPNYPSVNLGGEGSKAPPKEE